MRTFCTMLFSLSLMLAPLAYADDEHKEETTTTKHVEHQSEEGATNSNSPSTGDQLQGQDRADERHDMKSKRETTTTTTKTKHKHEDDDD